jgi:predicted transcriptional regulator
LGNYRKKIDIMGKILQIASGSAKKTQIMYQANLNHRILQKYLAELTQASLIKYEKTMEYYVTTETGHKFLNVYNEYTQNYNAMKKWEGDMLQKKAELEKISLSRLLV